MYIILIFVVILFLILDCIKKPSNIETFKVIYRSLDTCNKNNISDAINNIYNRVQHLKTNVNILNKQKYKEMYDWYYDKTFTQRNINNRNIILEPDQTSDKSSKDISNEDRKQKAIENIKSAKNTEKDLKKMIAKQNEAKSPENKLINSMTDGVLDGQTQNMDMSEITDEWVDTKASILMRDKDIYQEELDNIDDMSFDEEWSNKKNIWKNECKKCNNKCSVKYKDNSGTDFIEGSKKSNKVHCGDKFPKFTKEELDKLRDPYKAIVQKKAKKEALSVFLLRNIKNKEQLKFEIKVMKKDLMGEHIEETTPRFN